MNRNKSIILTLCIGLTLIISINNKPMNIYNSMQLTPVLEIIWGCICSCFIFSFHKFKSVRQLQGKDIYILFFIIFSFVSFEGFDTVFNIGYISLCLFYIIVRMACRIHVNIIYYCLVCSLIGLSMWGYLQLAGIVSSYNTFFCVTGPFLNPNILGLLMGILLCIMIHVLMFLYKNILLYRIHFCILLGIIITSLPVFICSNSRTGWLSFLFPILISYGPSIANKISKIHLFILSCVFFTSLLLLYSMRPLSVRGRLLIWKVSCEMIKDKPVFGFGSGGFEANYLYYQASYMKSNPESTEKYVAGNTHIAFNELLRMLVEHGIVGLVLYIYLILMIVKVRTYSLTTLRIAKSVLLSTLIQGTFSYPSLIMPIMFLTIIALALLMRGTSSIKVAKPCTIGIIIIMFMPLLFSIKSYIVYRKFYACIYESNNIEKKQREICSFFSQLRNDKTFLLYCICILPQDKEVFRFAINRLKRSHPTPIVFIKEGDYLTSLGRFKEAEKSYLLASNMMPAKQEARVRIALLYKQMGREREAKQLAKTILEEKVKTYSFKTYQLHDMLKKEFRTENSVSQ